MSNAFDPFDGLFSIYTERKPCCEALELRQTNMFEAAQFLMDIGYDIKIASGVDGITLTAQRDDVGFVASVQNGDALVHDAYADVQVVAGPDFRKAWEKA